MTERQRKDHERYMANREARIVAQREYYYGYARKGLRKPRKRKGRTKSEYMREYYQRNRDHILAYGRKYYVNNKDSIRRRRKQRLQEEWEKRIGNE